MGAVISASGSLKVSDNNLKLSATPVPNSSGLFFFGAAQTAVPFGQGTQCVGGQQFRLLPAVPAAGNVANRMLDFTGSGNESNIAPGETWYFQYWYRDPTVALPPDNFNLSDGLCITFATE